MTYSAKHILSIAALEDIAQLKLSERPQVRINYSNLTLLLSGTCSSKVVGLLVLSC